MISEIKTLIESSVGSKVLETKPVAGGCINQAYAIELADGRSLFAKLNDSSYAAEMFNVEAAGLKLLADPDAIRCLLYTSPSPRDRG